MDWSDFKKWFWRGFAFALGWALVEFIAGLVYGAFLVFVVGV